MLEYASTGNHERWNQRWRIRTKRRSWKRWGLIAGIVLLIGLGVWYMKFRKDNAPQYVTAAVTRGDMTQFVTAAGQLNPVTNVTVGCQISGTIAKLYADYNSPVTNGQVVAQIDPSMYLADLHSAEGDLANAEAALELAKVNEERSKELLANRLIPQSDNDQAVATLHQAEATVQIKRAAVEKARVNLQYCTIYSPVDGMVISRNVDVGQTVAASLNAPVLFVIANDLTKMQIDANVAESDVGGVEDQPECGFYRGRISEPDVPRQGGAGAQLADHGAECRHLRHGHRRQQRRFEAQARA